MQPALALLAAAPLLVARPPAAASAVTRETSPQEALASVTDPAPARGPQEGRPLGEIRGTVLWSDGSPAAGAEVWILPRGWANLDADDRARWKERYRAADGWYRSTEADEHGRFAFESRAGRHSRRHQYVVEACVGDLCSDATEPFHLEEDEPVDLVLRLPPLGRLEGRVLAPAGATWEDVSLLAWTAGEMSWFLWQDLKKRPQDRDRFPWARPDGEGRFSIASLPAGDYDLFLALPTANLRSSYHGGPWLASVAVKGGETTRADLDLRNRFPGYIDVTLHRGGIPAPGTLICGVARSWRYEIAEACEVTDPEGGARFGPVIGGRWHLYVAWEDLAAVDVPPGGVVKVTLDFEHHAGELQLLDETGAPAAGISVRIHLEGGGVLDLGADGEGRLGLELPAGCHSILGSRPYIPGRIIRWRTPVVPFEWPPPHGETPRIRVNTQ